MKSLVILATLGTLVSASAAELYVSTQGSDSNPGTRSAPLKSFAADQQAARRLTGHEPVTVIFADGSYYLPRTVTFTAADSGTGAAPVVYQSQNERGAVISGGEKLALTWKLYQGGIFQADVPADLETEEIFINGDRQILARYTISATGSSPNKSCLASGPKTSPTPPPPKTWWQTCLTVKKSSSSCSNAKVCSKTPR